MSDVAGFVGPNYSAHVADAIPAFAKNMRRGGMADDAERVRAWRGMIQRSIKFVLPPAGKYFSVGKGVPEGVYPQRLPYPLISLEVPYPESKEGWAGGLASTKRHVLCHEANLVTKPGGYTVDNSPQTPEGFFIYIFSYIDHARAWVPQECAAYVRYDTPTGPPSAATFAGEAWLPSGHTTAGFARVPLLQQMWERHVMQAGAEQATKDFARDTGEEVRIAFEFLQVLACRNVREVEHLPSEKLNAARKRSGKLPFDRYRVLQIGDVLIGRPHQSHEFDGTFKVREHFRSGHIRRLPTGQVWVTDTIVAAGSRIGRVTKRYEVPAALAARA